MAKRSAGKSPDVSGHESDRGSSRPLKPTKRVYPREYKLRVLAEVDALLEEGTPGAVGAYLRREGIHSSHLHRWRQERESGRMDGPERKAGRPAVRDLQKEENARLQRQVAKLEEKLRQAKLVIDVQKKLSALLGLEMPKESDDDDESS